MGIGAIRLVKSDLVGATPLLGAGKISFSVIQYTARPRTET
jgi:hypothetical protein